MKSEILKDVLAKKRGSGFDITISVGAAQEPKKDTDLAPPGEMHPDASQDKELIQNEIMKHEAEEPASEEEQLRKELMGHVSGPDMEDLQARKPRSLMERAKKAHIGKK